MAPISNLQDVKTWLGTLKVGDLAGISSGMFSAPLVEQALKLLPDSDPIVLKVTAIDVDGATISGTAAIVGEVGTAAVFAFTQPATDLLLTLSFTLPSTVDTESVQASYNAGVLKLELAKKAEAQPKRIKINVGGEKAVPAKVEEPELAGVR